MVYGDALTKAGRLIEIQTMFARQPYRTRTTAEIAERLGVHPRTVRKYLTELSSSGRLPVYASGTGWRLVEGARIPIPPVRFELEEATAVYIAVRRLTRRSGEPGGALRGAIGKLASVVPRELETAFERLAGRIDGAGSRHAATFRDLAYGWATGRTVEVRYRPRTGAGERQGLFEPYLLEPSVVGAALYAVGRFDPPGGLRVLRLERIAESRVTERPFTPPPVEALLDRVERSWGVWIADDEPVTVRLRFAPHAAGLVQETRWHPSQTLAEAPDGSLELGLTVTSATELVPWILGWGAACTVLEPAGLRETIHREHAEAARRYATSGTSS